jgi:hypothetical protein
VATLLFIAAACGTAAECDGSSPPSAVSAGERSCSAPAPATAPDASDSMASAATPFANSQSLPDLDAELNTEQLTQILYEVYSYPPLSPLTQLASSSQNIAAAAAATATIEPLSLTSPSHLSELNHYVFGGRRDFCQPFRVLLAGAGTGQKTANLMTQLVDMQHRRQCNNPSANGAAALPVIYEVVHLELSLSSIQIARTRVWHRLYNRRQLQAAEGCGTLSSSGQHTHAHKRHRSDADAESVEALALELGVKLSFVHASIFELPNLGLGAATFCLLSCFSFSVTPCLTLTSCVAQARSTTSIASVYCTSYPTPPARCVL